MQNCEIHNIELQYMSDACRECDDAEENAFRQDWMSEWERELEDSRPCSVHPDVLVPWMVDCPECIYEDEMSGEETVGGPYPPLERVPPHSRPMPGNEVIPF